MREKSSQICGKCNNTTLPLCFSWHSLWLRVTYNILTLTCPCGYMCLPLCVCVCACVCARAIICVRVHVRVCLLIQEQELVSLDEALANVPLKDKRFQWQKVKITHSINFYIWCSQLRQVKLFCLWILSEDTSVQELYIYIYCLVSPNLQETHKH